MPIGKIENFDLASKKWTLYVNRVKQFITLNDIKPEQKVATLITLVGEATYDLMFDLCAPVTPESKTFDQLVEIVQNHLEPKRSDIAERHIFRQRRQKPGETLSEYLQCLKHLASTCNFGSTLEENLRDQFVSGLGSETMRSHLFAETALTYKRAVELALALEAAERHAVEAGGSGSRAPGATGAQGAEGAGAAMHRLGAAAGTRPCADTSCWRCGKQHAADRCRYRQFNCDQCGARGHLKVMCKSGANNRDRATNRGYGKVTKPNQFYLDPESDSEDSDFFHLTVDGSGDKLYVVKILVENVPIVFEVDTGSKISAINEQMYTKHFSNFTINELASSHRSS